jgi:NADPH:quinone reductase
MTKRLTVIGTMLRSRTDDEKAAAVDAFAAEVGPLLGAGGITPAVAHIVPLAQAEHAYELLEADATFGKVILDCR